MCRFRLHQAAGTIGAVGTTGSYATTDYPEATITLVIGEQEAANGEVAIRKRGQGDVGKMKLEDFAELCKKQVETMEKW